MTDSAVPLALPVQLYTMPRQFSTVFNGKIYVGAVDTNPTAEANRITVYHEGENGTLTPIAQPIAINAGGYPVISGQVVKLVVTQDYSIAVYDQLGAQAFYFPRCRGPYILNVYHDQTLHGTGTESDLLGVQLSEDEGNQLQIRDDGLYYGLVGPDDIINLYVTTAGSNDAAGTRAAPLQTVGEALRRIAERAMPGSYTIHLRAGETFALDKSYSLGVGSFHLTFIYYDDPIFEDYRSRYGWWPEADDRLQRPTLIFDTFVQDNGMVSGTAIGSSTGLQLLIYEGINLVLKTTAGGPTGGGQFVSCSDLRFYGCNVFIEGVLGVGAASSVGLHSSNYYFHGTAHLLAIDLSPSVVEISLAPEGAIVRDPLGEGPDVIGRATNVFTALTPDNLVGGGTYDKSTKSTFGWSTNWDIFAASA
ncbi:phage tailspike protein [Erwinia sp. OPT-41]|uniref:Phage tailspike protein n=1 Tax=Erwinia plantamica TaxID=3237104 RepID=A0ABW7CL97_9GAMM